MSKRKGAAIDKWGRYLAEDTPFTWRCACGRIFFSVVLSRATHVGPWGKVVFHGKCPTCKRPRRRTMLMRQRDFKGAQTMVKAAMGTSIRPRVIKWYTGYVWSKTDSLYVTKIVRYMRQHGYTVDRITELIAKRHKVSRATISNMSAKHQVRRLALLMAHPSAIKSFSQRPGRPWTR